MVQADQKLNVLLITADDLGLQLSCYGNQVIETPHLDQLAKQGTRFEVAYVVQSSCSPSRSGIFTGLFPHANGQYGLTNQKTSFELHEGLVERTIPAYLKRAGYRTGIIGKLHVNPQGEFPFDERMRLDTRDVRLVAERAVTFMKKESPFFLMVNYSDPHAARENPQTSDWFFPDQIKGLPDNPLKLSKTPPLPFQRIDEQEQLIRVRGFYNCVKRLDDGVGMLMAALKESGKADKTLVMFVGDHGPPFDRGKTTCYEAGMRVPFIVQWPGVSKVPVSEAMVSTVDLLPTILDATGLKPEGELHGRSLRPVLEDENVDWRNYLAGEYQFHGPRPFFPQRCIRDDRYHLIHTLRPGEVRPPHGIDGDQAYKLAEKSKYDETDVDQAFAIYADPPEFQLFDLQADPWEFTNLAGQTEVAEVESRLKRALMDWRKATNDPLLTPSGLREMVNASSEPSQK